MEIREHELGPDSRDVGETLNNLGVLFRELGRFDEAVPYLERADSIFVESLGADHPVRVAGLNNLGMVEHLLRHWQASETHLRRAITIWEATYGEGHPRTIKGRFYLAKLCRSMGREAEAAEYLRKNLGYRPTLEEKAGNLIAPMLRELGLALGHLGEFPAAVAALQETRELSLPLAARIALLS